MIRLNKMNKQNNIVQTLLKLAEKIGKPNMEVKEKSETGRK